MKRIKSDVVVVGCGAAGLAAALTALEASASVTVLERSPEADRGGNTRWTEALLRLTEGGDLRPDFVDLYMAQSGYHITPEFEAETTRDYSAWPTLVKALPFNDPELLSAFFDGVPP